MDDTTFQQELIRLKDHVTRMASKYQPSPVMRAQPTFRHSRQDAFCDQLDEVKCRLATMQMSLNKFLGLRDQRQPTELVSRVGHSTYLTDDNTVSSKSLTLPSGPVFWQLFTSLRTDIRGLDSRVANLEQNVSSLEDRVDNLEPPQFTPTTSEDTFFPLSAEDEAKSPALLQNALAEDPIPYVTDLSGWQAGHYAQINRFAPSAHSATELSGSKTNSRWDESQVGPRSYASAPEGVAFRDREIAQLEELMRSTQASLKHTEDLLHQREDHIRVVTAQRDQTYARKEDLERICADHNRAAKQYQGTLALQSRGFQDELELKEADLRRLAADRIKMGRIEAQRLSELRHAKEHIQHLQKSLYDLHNAKQDEVDRAVFEKDEEIKRLRHLFEAKESVIYEQDKIIGRGVTLLQERENEMEQLDKELKLVKDDRRDEARQRSRAEKLLKERNDEISQLKASLTQALMPQSIFSKLNDGSRSPAGCDESRQHRPDTFSAPTTMPCSPFATAGVTGQTSVSGQWTPKAFNSPQLPHERKRASAWQTNAKDHNPSTFGIPSAISMPQPHSTGMSATKRRDLRRSHSLRLLERLASAEDGSSDFELPKYLRRDNDRHKLPLDGLQPPLPAPVSPRKAASEANLAFRSRAEEVEVEHRRPMSRQQCIQALSKRKRKLQPYVEDYEAGEA